MWFLIQNVYGATSVTLYAIVTYLIIRERRHFAKSFLVLFVVFAIVNIHSYIAFYMSLRLPIFTPPTSPIAPLFEHFPVPSILPWFTFLCYYLPFCQNTTILLFIFNRFRAIAFPFAKETTVEIPLSLVAIFLLPLPLCYDMLLKETRYEFRQSFNGYVLVSKTAYERERLLYLVVFQCTVAVVGLAINAAGVVLLLRRSPSQNRRKETRLFFVSCICFIFQSVNALAMLCIYVLAWDSRAIVVTIFALPICNDLNSLSLPYYFVLINSRIKKAFLQLPLCRRLSPQRTLEDSSKPAAL
ncbi:unnamed protein product [Heligmosomoides polygyrus]|uniref:Serpentine receptor class gamma n=1 Tax=Heligmosomoides polygyrus TaxID=6339 RepID=A0A183G4N7_HELPZ|nr:unnamed protein product [Heligmosomoides polygyrus]